MRINMSNSLEIALGKVIVVIFMIIGMIPRKWTFWISRLLGRLGFELNKKHQKIATDNLTQAFGHEKTEHEIKLLAKEVFAHLVQMVFDIGWSLWLKPHEYHKHFKVEGLDHLRTIYKTKQGGLLLTAHVGHWELSPMPQYITGLPITVIYRTLDFPPLDYFIKVIRSRSGARLVPLGKAKVKVLEHMGQGDMVFMLVDQNVDWYEGVFVDFFGKRACTNKGVAMLSIFTGASMYPFFVVRDGLGFKAIIKKQLPLINTGDFTKDVEANTQLYNHAVEEIAREFPEQYFWVHQRWKTRPYCPWPPNRS